MKRIVLLAVVLAAAAGVGYAAYPDDLLRFAEAARGVGLRAADGVAANPAPVALALGGFLLTVVYHKARGKSLRESVEVAATRVTVVPVRVEPVGDETPVVRRAKARTTRTQLIADQILLQNRFRKLPDEVAKAEKEACYTEQAVSDAERAVQDRWAAHDAAAAKLETLRKEQAAGEAELAAIDAELKKLAELV
jgi:hypothetical protein